MTIFVLIGVLYIGICVLVYFQQNKLLFFPEKLAADYQFQYDRPFEVVNLKIGSEVSLNALHFKVPDDSSRKVILYFHGNAGSLAGWGRVADDFLPLGYNLFVVDYRTYGKSTGPLNSEKDLFDDALYCFDYLSKFYPPENITIYGRSLGSGIATYTASKRSAKRLILETPYTSIVDVGKLHYPMLPHAWLSKFPLRSDVFIQNVTMPITIFHGTEDKVIPYSLGKKLANSAKNVQFITLDGANHHNLVEYEAYQQGLREVLK